MTVSVIDGIQRERGFRGMDYGLWIGKVTPVCYRYILMHDHYL